MWLGWRKAYHPWNEHRTNNGPQLHWNQPISVASTDRYFPHLLDGQRTNFDGWAELAQHKILRRELGQGGQGAGVNDLRIAKVFDSDVLETNMLDQL